MKIVLRKAVNKDGKLAYFKQKILEHLDTLAEQKPSPIKKALLIISKGGKGLPVGSIREWKGKKFIKTPSGKWKPKYESEGGRGIKLSLAALRRAVDKAQTPQDLMNIVLDNRDRFSDKQGQPLPIVQELSQYVSQRHKKVEGNSSKQTKQTEFREFHTEGGMPESKPEMKPQASKPTDNDNDKDDSDLPEETEEEKRRNEKAASSTVPEITKQYYSFPAKYGDEDDININGMEVQGRWKLVEADAPTASHNEQSFASSKGFPVNEEGKNINDRDYQHDRDAQEAVARVGTNYDSRALSMDTPVVVSQEGVVLSGNNRTMSSKLAAAGGTDGKYIAALQKKAGRYGFSSKDLKAFKHPRIVFEIEHEGPYTTQEFAQYNTQEQKSMSPVETAVKMSKLMTPALTGEIATYISDFETLSDMYGDTQAMSNIWDKLIKNRVISIMQLPMYFSMQDNVTSDAGKEFLENVLIASFIKEDNLRQMAMPGGKSIRQQMVYGLLPLTQNAGLEGYSIKNELNWAIKLAIHSKRSKNAGNVDDIVSQQDAFAEHKYSPLEGQLAKKLLEGKPKVFQGWIKEVQMGLTIGASGQTDIFVGNTESKEDILNRFLTLKKSIQNILSFLRKAQGIFVKQPVEVFRDGKPGMEMRWTIQKSPEDGGVPARFDVALDFDGVINSYQSGWRGETETDEPVPGAATGIRALIDGGRTVAIYSTRAATPEGEQTIRDYLRDMIGEAYSQQIAISDRKPIATVYMDDRALTFTGDWKDIPAKIEAFKPWIDKSLTWSGYKLQGRTKIHGMDISIENKQGSIRRGTDKDGHEWSTKMHYDYGYIRGTVGRDKDHLDVYIGPNPDSETVFIVHQNDPVTRKYDEDKVMLGFDSEEEARKAYLSQYDRPGFLGDIAVMGIEEFKEKVFDEAHKGKKIA